MRVVNENLNTIQEYDLLYGYLKNGICVKEDATPPDWVNKKAWSKDDFEDVQIYIMYPWAKSNENINEIKNIFINNLSKECSEAIVTGIDYNGQHYSMTIEDQLNMIERCSRFSAGQDTVPYHADGEACREYDATEFLALAAKATRHKEYHLTYFNALKKYILSMNNISDVVSCYYGMEIPDEYQTDELRKIMADEN